MKENENISQVAEIAFQHTKETSIQFLNYRPKEMHFFSLFAFRRFV